MIKRFILAALVAAGLGAATFVPANAATTCEFDTVTDPDVMKLTASCTTDQTIFVLSGKTLDGNGKTITAVDPVGGHFLGAVVKNEGTTANVRNLTVTVSGLADACDGGVHRLRGILFDGAAGSITNNKVLGLKQAVTSGCQEGNAIEVRNFDAPGTRTVMISGNTVTDYQKTGINVNGAVNAAVTGNTITGAGPINYIAQNGVQFGFGATGTIQGNSISGNNYTPADTISCGILFFEAEGVRQSRNAFANNERDICNFGRGGGQPNQPSQ